ncbi:lipopolysaccharide biosynthesis protein [Cellulomonas fengjieae]|uniref:Polysaccharide biosynthesis protein n=1 Tax=Cellulomonas fengjieae TaxID=2819978 RepID=A0ABS3SDM1_9CELL|nr:hypothetical protein [Cellulomonas fengjieae]MBO3083853.1 hypothetical protein [Cellulomonas fengjieae]QVI64861.1 hypothetical protein KG102_11925 [Cellulomonas fengjieae]
MRSFGGRLAGFAGLPMISLVTPLLVLPVLGRVAGQAGWASLAAGESIGTLAAIAIAYGWNTAGPPRIALTDDREARARFYRESLAVRGALTVALVPVVSLICWLVAAPGYGWPTVLMGLAGSVTGLSFSWYAVGAADPRSIALYEAVPRVAAAALSAALVIATKELTLYPLLALTASLGGLVLFSRRTLAGTAPVRWSRAGLWRLVVRDRAIAFNDIAGGAYQSLPVPVVSATAPAAAASSFASADKLFKFGLYVPITLANAFQSWTVEGRLDERAHRLRVALAAHVGVGIVGWAVLAVLGPWASGVLFGPDVAATRPACFWLGAAFFLVSARISATRHVLVPAGRVRQVVVSTIWGAVVGITGIAVLAWAVGPVGAAVGLLLGELVATTVVMLPALRHIAAISSTHAGTPTVTP